MKTYVITVSKVFPKGHWREGEETLFPWKIFRGMKIHTIRQNYELWHKRFEKIARGEACLSIRSWESSPYRSKQTELLRLTHENGIGIEKLEWDPGIIINGNRQKGDVLKIAAEMANNDGLDILDMESWFRNAHSPLVIIHFTKFRYTSKFY